MSYRVYKRPGCKNYYAEIRIKGAKRIVPRSTGTADAVKAEEFARHWENEVWRQIKLGEKPRRTWGDALGLWRKASENNKSLEIAVYMLRVLHPYFDKMYLDEVDEDHLDQVFDDIKDKRDIQNTSVNRYIKIVKRILTLCVRKRWIDSAPHIELLPDDSARMRWLTERQARVLINTLPDEHAAAARFALATGLRKGNIYRGLKWSHVDLEKRLAWFERTEMKSGRSLAAPLNSEAVEVLRGQIGKDPVFVFGCNPLINRQWKKHVARAGLTGLRFHDLRHTWATWHVQRGTSLDHLMQLGDWSSYKMVLRYAHFTPKDLAPAAENVATNLQQSKVLKYKEVP